MRTGPLCCQSGRDRQQLLESRAGLAPADYDRCCQHCVPDCRRICRSAFLCNIRTTASGPKACDQTRTSASRPRTKAVALNVAAAQLNRTLPFKPQSSEEIPLLIDKVIPMKRRIGAGYLRPARAALRQRCLGSRPHPSGRYGKFAQLCTKTIIVREVHKICEPYVEGLFVLNLLVCRPIWLSTIWNTKTLACLRLTASSLLPCCKIGTISNPKAMTRPPACTAMMCPT